MTWTLIYTRDIQKNKNEKEKATSLPRRRFCLLNGVGGAMLKNLHFSSGESKKKITREKPKIAHITGVQALLTIIINRFRTKFELNDNSNEF